MPVSREQVSTAELYDAFYAALGVMDQVFEFWLTATFAVVVASNFMTGRLNRRLAGLIAAAYSFFSVAMLFRWMIASGQMLDKRDRLIVAGENYPLEASNIAGLLMIMTYAIGLVAALFFVWSAYRESR